MEATIEYVNNNKGSPDPDINFPTVLRNLLKYVNFGYQLMYLKYANKQNINDFIKENNIYTNSNFTPENIDYLNNLPTDIINYDLLDNDSIEMLNILKWKEEYIYRTQLQLMHAHVLRYIKIKYPKYKVIINALKYLGLYTTVYFRF